MSVGTSAGLHDDLTPLGAGSICCYPRVARQRFSLVHRGPVHTRGVRSSPTICWQGNSLVLRLDNSSTDRLAMAFFLGQFHQPEIVGESGRLVPR
jgi:hypothetical protein